MTKRTLFLILGVIAVLVFLAVLVVSPKNATTSSLSQMIAKPTITMQQKATVTLYFNQNYKEENPSNPITGVSVRINPNSDKYRISAVQLTIHYDSKAITNVAITPKDFFPNPVVLVKRIDPIAGTINLTVAARPGEYGNTQKSTVAFISFTPLLKPGQTTKFSFDKSSLVTAEGVSKSILKNRKSVTYTIQ